jgi:hypothetical protein
MPRIPICTFAICLLLSLFLVPHLFAQNNFEQFNYSILGEGSLTVETSAFEKGNVISLETNLQDVTAIVVTDDAPHRELVRVETKLMAEETRTKRVLTPVASVIVDADTLQGRFEQKIAYNLSRSKTLRITLTLASGIEVPFVLGSRESMANRKITWTFNGKNCPLVTLGCTGLCSVTFPCCSIRYCLDCSTCTYGCGSEACGGGWDGGGCLTAPNPDEQKLFVIPLDGGDAPDLAPSSFGLHRTERSTTTLSFLMEEWAVLSYSTRAGEVNPNVKVLSSSSPEFGASKSLDLDRGARNTREKRADRTPSQGTVLVVEAPVHPLNSRFATLPKLRSADLNVPVGMAPFELVVRADFAADKSSPDGLQVLHANGVVSADLVELLKERLEVERVAGTRHRVIVYARVRVDGTRVNASSLAMVMPKCCCGGRRCV